jgi:hypothetical protein
MTAEVTDRFDDWTDEQLEAAIADLEQRLAAAGVAGGEKGAEGSSEPPDDLSTLQ